MVAEKRGRRSERRTRKRKRKKKMRKIEKEEMQNAHKGRKFLLFRSLHTSSSPRTFAHTYTNREEEIENSANAAFGSDFDEEQQKVLKTGLQIFNNTSPKKGVKYLIEQNLLTTDPSEIAKFLLNCDELSKRQIGDYLGYVCAERARRKEKPGR